MPELTPATGLHAPITNIIPSESTVINTAESPGSTGFGDVWPIDNSAVFETIPKEVQESLAADLFTFSIPDMSALADIGAASYGPVREAVIGTDKRVRITETKKYPWRVSASLLITANDDSQWIGTAWLISPRTLVTAGHCVYIKNSGFSNRDGWVKKIQVMPGRNGSDLPFGALTATEFWTVQGWGEKGLESCDYGAIILPSSFKEDLGYLWFGVYKDEVLKESIANVEGYPGDKPSGTLWYDNRKIGSVTPDKVYYAADTAGGQSGAVVYIVQNGERKAIAIHTYGGNTSNSGTRISSQVYSNLEAWKRN